MSEKAEEKSLFSKDEEEYVLTELEQIGHQLKLNKTSRKAGDIKAFVREMVERAY